MLKFISYILKKRLLIFVSSFLLFGFLSVVAVPKKLIAARVSQHSLYLQNNYIINPALAGIEKFIDLNFSMYNQWVGIHGAPTSYFFTVQGPIDFNSQEKQSHLGVGGKIVYDQSGALSTFSGNLTLAYHLVLTKNSTIAFGLLGGTTQYRLDKDKLDPDDPDDQNLVLAKLSQFVYDADLGVWFYTDKLYLGLTLQDIFYKPINFGLSQQSIKHDLYANTLLVMAGYLYPVSESIALFPSTLMRVTRNDKSIVVDMNLRVLYKEIFWIGISYRNLSSFSILAGMNVNPLFNISYGFDYGFNKLSGLNFGSHQINLGFQLNNKEKERCPQNVW